MLQSQTTDQRVLELPRLHISQQQCIDEAKRFNVPNCGRRFGKTILGEDLVINNLTERKAVAWFSPTYKMLEDVWRELVNVLYPITETKSEQQHNIRTIGGGVLDCWSLDAADSARGRKYDLIIVDEAAMVANLEEIWNMILRPMLVDTKGKAWFLSTPKGRNGFYKLHVLGRDPDSEEWKSWTFPTCMNPHIPRTEVEKLKDTMSEEAYRQEILAEFLEGEGIVFRNLRAVLTAPTTIPGEHSGHIIVAGIDWGKQNDFTAISIGCANCRREIAKDKFNQIDYAFQTQRVKKLFHEWGVKTGLVEMNSMGIPLFEQLQREGLPVVGFETTAQSKPILIEGAALEIEKGTLTLLPDDVWTAELEAYERKVNESTGRSSYGAPEGMHDDTVIARALMIKAMNNYAYMSRQAKRNQSPLAEIF